MINDNVLIVSDREIVKIYDQFEAKVIDEKVSPTLQSYYNYLPEPKANEKDRRIPLRNVRNCRRHHRLVMQFNYPKSGRAKQIVATPFISANTIGLNIRKSDSNLTWIANKSIDDSKERLSFSKISNSNNSSTQLVTRIF